MDRGAAGAVRSSRPRRGSLGGLAVVVLGLGAALLAPIWGTRADAGARPVHALLVDVSPSAVRRRPDYTSRVRRWLAEAAHRAADQRADVIVVGFDAHANRAFGPEEPKQLLEWLEGRRGDPLDPLEWCSTSSQTRPGSRVDRALDLVEAFVRPTARGSGDSPAVSVPGHVWILGDGTHTGASPRGRALALSSEGVPVEWESIGEPDLADVGIVELDLPRSVERGGALVAAVELAWSRGRLAGKDPSVQLEVAVEDSAGRRTLTAPIQSIAELQRPASAQDPASEFTWREHVALGPAAGGVTRVEARVKLLGASDSVAENNRAVAEVAVEGALVVGVVAPRGGSASLSAWLRAGASDKWQVVPIEVGEWAAGLEGVDVVVTLDVPLEELAPEPLAQHLSTGGGWLHAGGWNFLGQVPPGWDELLALRPDWGEGEPRDVWILVDGSGSMAGEPFDRVREAAVALVRAAPVRDGVRLALFNVTLGQRFELKRAGEPSTAESVALAASRLLAARTPRGSTDVIGALESLSVERAGAKREALVFLLTDGRQTRSAVHIARRAKELLANLSASRTRMRVIAVGEDADRSLLAQLVAPGDELLFARELERVGELFQRELNRERVREGDPLSVVSARGTALVDRAFPEGLAAPAIARCLRVRTAPGAQRVEPVWVAEEGHPILAVLRVGLGLSATLATRAEAGWSPDPGELVDKLEPLVRVLGTQERPDRPYLRWDEGELWLEGWTSGGVPRSDATSLGRSAVVLAGTAFTGRPPDSEARDLLWSPATTPGGLRIANAWRTTPSWDLPVSMLAAARVLVYDSERVWELSLPERPDAEFWPRAKAWRPGLIPEPAPTQTARSRSGRGHRAGSWVLAAGLLMLFWHGWQSRA